MQMLFRWLLAVKAGRWPFEGEAKRVDLENRDRKPIFRYCGREDNAADLVHDAVAGYVDEIADTQQMLDARYDDMKSGKVKMIPGDEAFARPMAKTEAERQRSRRQITKVMSFIRKPTEMLTKSETTLRQTNALI